MSKKSPARHRESAPAPSWFDDARYEDVRFSATFEYNELSLNRAAEQIAPRLKGILTVADFGSLIVLILLAMALRDQTLLLVIVFLIPATLLYVTNNLSSLQVRYARGTNLDPVTMGSRVHVTVCENSLHLCNDEGGQQDFDLSDLRFVHDTSDFLVAGFARRRYVFVPRSALSENRFHDLVRFLDEKAGR